jgi:hypothetical protein
LYVCGVNVAVWVYEDAGSNMNGVDYMNRNQLQRANTIEACISSAESNMASWEELKQAKEIQIRSNDDGIVVQPKYISGKLKDRIIDILIEEQRIFRDKHLIELSKI